MKTLNTVSMYALNVDKNEFLERLASLSLEGQRIIFNKLSELREEEEKKEKTFLGAIKLGEESGIANVDLDSHFEKFFTKLDEQENS